MHLFYFINDLKANRPAHALPGRIMPQLPAAASSVTLPGSFLPRPSGRGSTDGSRRSDNSALLCICHGFTLEFCWCKEVSSSTCVSSILHTDAGELSRPGQLGLLPPLFLPHCSEFRVSSPRKNPGCGSQLSCFLGMEMRSTISHLSRGRPADRKAIVSQMKGPRGR